MAFALALPLTVSVSTAFAQSAAPAAPAPVTPAPVVDVRAVCKPDMDKLCPNVERGVARRACIETNRDKFSDACKTARNAAHDARQDRREAFRAACSDDIAKLCASADADKGKGKGRTVECVKSNADKLTSTCKAELTKFSAHAPAEAAGSTRKQ